MDLDQFLQCLQSDDEEDMPLPFPMRSSAHYGIKRRLGRGTNTRSYGVRPTKKPRSDEPQAKSGPRQKFACPFFKAGIINEKQRSCSGPGWFEFHRVIEHIDRAHTPERYKKENLTRTCVRCDQGFKTAELLAKHQRQQIPCTVAPPEYILGAITRDQAESLRLCKKRFVKLSYEDRWRELFRMVMPLYIGDVDAISPYYEKTTVSSFSTCSAQSFLSQYRDHLRSEPSDKEKEQMAVDMKKRMGVSDPEEQKRWLAYIRELGLRQLQEFEDKLKPTYAFQPSSYDIVDSGGAEKPEPAIFDDFLNMAMFGE